MDQDKQNFYDTVAQRSSGGALRGDYSTVGPDYTVRQDYACYTPAEQDLWRALYARQLALLPGRACEEFIVNLGKMSAAHAIPDLDAVSERLSAATGWRLVAVPGLIPDQAFFEHLAARRFPVTVWLRKPEEFDYIVEPDIFHDFFGHVPLLFDPVFADHLQEYGKGGIKALSLDALTQLARLYWYTIEFGLIRTAQGLRSYGAGILSSPGEIDYCLTSPKPRRIPFKVERVLQTLYKIDSFQQTYFVIDSFAQLLEDTRPDFAPLYDQLRALPPLPADSLLPGELGLGLG